jgi:hypothetical protein
MRKWMMTAALAAVTCLAQGQTMTSKNGTPILPEAGDWSIGFDAAPWLSYAGNLLSSGGKNSVNSSYQQANTIVGKYMINENTAIRAKVRVGFSHTSSDAFVPSATDPINKVTDNVSNNALNVTLGAGIQKYRGKGRLKGYYGGEAAIMLGSNSSTYTYGNALTANNFSTRPSAANSGSTFGVGVRGFIGAEYFFAPKISIGAEYGWGLMFTHLGESTTTTQTFDGSTNSIKSSSINTGGNSSFNLDVDNAGGAIYLSLYF